MYNYISIFTYGMYIYIYMYVCVYVPALLFHLFSPKCCYLLFSYACSGFFSISCWIPYFKLHTHTFVHTT